MNKFKKAPKPKKEFWGEWEDRSDKVIKYHPINQRQPGFIVAGLLNNVLSVQISHEPSSWGTITHLWIRRHDSQPLTWREMQRVKNETVGMERIAVEVYPAESELVDSANMYHLWVLPEGFQLPFSLKERELEPTA